MTLLLHATPGEVMRSVEELREFGRGHAIKEGDLFGLLLALEECGSNIVDHAFGRDARRRFNVTMEYDGQNLTLELRDSGPEFDPTSFRKAQAAEHDSVGGWGLQLVRQSVDEVRYRRDGTENILRLTKVVRSRQSVTKPESKREKHMALEILILQKDKTKTGATTVKLSGSLDTATAPELERRLSPILAAPIQDVVFDLADLQFISSAGLRVFANARKVVKVRGGQASFIRMQPQILEVFAIIQSLPGVAVFKGEEEFDQYIAARQHAHQSST
jgi:anti-sigma B factor antagonist